jgi:hypothetical protein
MKSKHVLVVLLDLPELLPFTISEQKDLKKSLKEQEKSLLEMSKFIDLLSKNYKEEIYFIGQDIIADKFLNRFLFKKEGFLEIMMAKPVAVAAHFVNKDKAEKFVLALKAVLKKMLPKTKAAELMIDSIETTEEFDEMLSFDSWNKIKNIRNDIS